MPFINAITVPNSKNLKNFFKTAFMQAFYFLSRYLFVKYFFTQNKKIVKFDAKSKNLTIFLSFLINFTAFSYSISYFFIRYTRV